MKMIILLFFRSRYLFINFAAKTGHTCHYLCMWYLWVAGCYDGRMMGGCRYTSINAQNFFHCPEVAYVLHKTFQRKSYLRWVKNTLVAQYIHIYIPITCKQHRTYQYTSLLLFSSSHLIPCSSLSFIFGH